MKRYRYLDSCWGKGILTLFLLASVLLARDAQIAMAILGLNKSQLLLAGLTGALGLGFLIRNYRDWKALLWNRRIGVVLTAAAVLLIPMLVKRDWQLVYFSMLFCVAYAVLLTYFTSCQEVSKIYVLIMTALAAYSVLTTYVLRRIPDSGSGLIGSFYGDTGVLFYNFGLSYVSESFVKNRNFGIFREPGVYQYFLLLAIYLANDRVQWKIRRTFVLVNLTLAATMLTTFATGGVIEMALLYGFLFVDKKLYRDKKTRWTVLSLVTAGIAAAIIVLAWQGTIYREVYDMFIGKFRPGQDSGVDRINSIVLNTRAFLRSPLVGEKIASVLYALDNNTSSSTILFAVLGIAGGLFHGMSWVALSWRKNRSIGMNLALLVILAMSFNTENMITDLFLWLMPVMALTEKIMERQTNQYHKAKENRAVKRMLFLTNYPSPYRIDFFDEMGKYVDLTVLFTSEPKNIKDRNMQWFREGKGTFRGIFLKKTLTMGEEILSLEAIKWLKQEYDVILVGGYGPPTSMLAMVYLRLKKIPFYLEVDGCLPRRESKLKYRFKRFLVRLASGWFSTGPYSSEILVHYGAEPEKIWEYPFTSLWERDLLAAPPAVQEKEQLRRELGMKEPKIVVSVGRFIPVKGFDLLMRAAEELSEDIGIYIVGGEPPQEYLQMREERELRRLHFVDFQNKDGLNKYFQAADLSVLATRGDVWGLVINESMANGLPVVTTDRCVAGLELVEAGKNGYIVPTEDAKALADGIKRVFAQNYQEMGAAALKKIQPYTVENMARTHWSILQKYIFGGDGSAQ